MKITVIKQMAKSVMEEDLPNFEKRIGRIKWFLWHGNVFKALDILESLNSELDSEILKRVKVLRNINFGKLLMNFMSTFKPIAPSSLIMVNGIIMERLFHQLWRSQR